MNLGKKQNLIIVIAITVIVLGFSISNYIKQQKVYVLSHEEKKDILHESSTESGKDSSSNRDEINSEKIVVHIEGEVVSPGVYELDKDTRVFDVIEAAGGLLETANRKKINLAKKIVDEEYIYIPSESDENVEIQNITNAPITTNINKNESLVNINNASMTELNSLPGIGEVLANRIIEYRSEKGDFKSVEELKNVSGIGDKKFSEIKDKVTVK
ncbi:helix-hairpin-helix domain-containing protein [Alkaliphilus sp. MSJ-5]|uniref:Helix-hairpin-helix domain-containing protein n=1 Tax=Alkaliphilus flagellatus TaxID=2841507 RepID=A0ABS6G5S9_9FIRM|nr:helix-hairpin-helix domain-containing protein [Alkaliphilus flagellatus]MBU5677729.1 helix-hairpin-helix domain-containing protein [Alkaliphilus flagellatus]